MRLPRLTAVGGRSVRGARSRRTAPLLALDASKLRLALGSSLARLGCDASSTLVVEVRTDCVPGEYQSGRLVTRAGNHRDAWGSAGGGSR